jgi:hypothetical protein
MQIKTILANLISLILITSVFACSNGVKSPTNDTQVNSQPSTAVTANSTTVAAKTDKIKFKTEGGAELFSLKQQADGAKLVDGNNQELAKIKLDKPGQIKLKNAADKVLGYVVTESGIWKLQNPDGKQDLFILQKQSNGEYQLTDAGKKVVYQIKSKNNGWEISTPSNQLVYQVKVKNSKISLRNPAQKTIFSTKSEISPIAFACLGFDVITREQQVALAYAVNLTGGQ